MFERIQTAIPAREWRRVARLAGKRLEHYDFLRGWAEYSVGNWPVLESFYPLIVYGVVLIGFVITNLVLAHIAGPRKKTAIKEMPYESGMDPIGDARQPYDVRFYIVAILFLVFDVELLFLYPWAVAAYTEGGIPAELRGIVFGIMMSFISTLVIAYVYAWRKGVFRWR